MRALRAVIGVGLGSMAVAACSLANKSDDPLPSSTFTQVPGAQPVCPAGAEVCGHACVDLKANRLNCGACDQACADGKDCVMGKCQISCGGTSVRCGDKCFDVKQDPLNCGDCGKTCPTGMNALALCAAGMCQSVCKAPFHDCDAKPDDGCETDVTANKDNCGACGAVCPAMASHASPKCTAGACQPNCDPGFGDCDGDVANGCEVDLSKDMNNCGVCGTKCDPATQLCVPPMPNAPSTCQNGLVIKIDGHADVLVTCKAGDYNCQAQQVCEKVTKTTCTMQPYDCYFGIGPSWFPNDGASGSSNFNFTTNYDISPGGWGNICACNPMQLQKYGLSATHTGCGIGSGHWTRQ